MKKKKNERNKGLRIVRVQKALALCSLYSRRKAEELIARGRVTVNGEKALPGQLVDLEKDLIEVDGQKLVFDLKPCYLMLNKPPGYISTSSDELGRKTVFSLLKGYPGEKRLVIVGRLDKNSRGLILLTNDGELAFRVMHPRFGVEKEYRVEIEGVPGKEVLRKIERGFYLERGERVSAKVKILKRKEKRTVVKMVLKEGKKREIRRLWKKFGFQVLDLKRERIGSLKLGALQPGRWRKLSEKEVLLLRQSAGLDRLDK